MTYAGRHRQVAPERRRTRRSRMAAVMAGALIAPLTYNPTPAQAAVTTAKPDSLANHPEWRLSASDPAVAGRIANLKATLTQRGISYDAAAVAAYRVPTVEGFTTYVTASPETMTVRPNPQLLARTPEGVTPVDPAVVLTRLIAPEAEGAGGVGLPALPSAAIAHTVYNAAWYELARYGIDQGDIDSLLTALSTLLRDAVEGDTRAAIDQLKAQFNSGVLLVEQTAAEKLRQVADILYATPIKDVFIGRLFEALGPALQSADLLKQFVVDYVNALDVLAELDKALDRVPVRDEEIVALARAATDKLKQESPPSDPYSVLHRIENIVAGYLDPLLVRAGLPTLSALQLSAVVTEVVPVAAVDSPDLVENVMTNPNLPDGTREEESDGRAANWETRRKDCFQVSTEAFWRLVCWRIDKQIKDNDRHHNFWQFHVDGGGKSVGYRYMDRMWLEAKPQPVGASNQAWDQLPKPSAEFGGSGGCTTEGSTFEIASGAPVQVGFGYYWERMTCETYEPKSYGDEGHWASIWTGNPYVAPEKFRSVMVKVPVKTPTDKGVWWDLLTGQRTRR